MTSLISALFFEHLSVGLWPVTVDSAFKRRGIGPSYALVTHCSLGVNLVRAVPAETPIEAPGDATEVSHLLTVENSVEVKVEQAAAVEVLSPKLEKVSLMSKHSIVVLIRRHETIKMDTTDDNDDLDMVVG